MPVLTLKNAQNESVLKINTEKIKAVTLYSGNIYKVFTSVKNFHLVYKDESLLPFITAYVQLSIFGTDDLAQKNKEKGIKKAIDNAVKNDVEWREKAKEVFNIYLKKIERNYSFMTEDVRSFAEQNSLISNPPSKRAWGSITATMAREGFISKVGIGPVKNPKANHANAAIWQKV